MTALLTLSIVLAVLLACTATVVAIGGRRVTASWGYASALLSINTALTLKHAPTWEHLPLIGAATALLATAIALGITGRGTRRQPEPLTASAPSGEPEDEIPAAYRNQEN